MNKPSNLRPGGQGRSHMHGRIPQVECTPAQQDCIRKHMSTCNQNTTTAVKCRERGQGESFDDTGR